MAALTSDRNTRAAAGAFRTAPVAAGVRIFAGALLVRDAAGHVKPGVTETGSYGIGRAEEAVDNSAGLAGAVNVAWRAGVYCYRNSAGADAIDASHVGLPCHVVDDQTVAATDGTGTRSVAGIVDGVGPEGVWVRCDEALARVI